MERHCPICKDKMTHLEEFGYVDYHCNSLLNDHHYSERVSDGKKTMMKVRVSPSHRRLYLKVDYNKGFSEIWEGIENQNRIHVDQIVSLNFESLDSIVTKLKTYLVFS